MGAAGADPSEPADPWREPAGTVSFAYTGRSWRCNWRPALTGATCSSPWTVRRPTLPAITGNVDMRRPGRLHYVVRARRDHRRRPLGRRAAQRCGPAPTAVHTRRVPRSGAVGDRRRCGPWPSIVAARSAAGWPGVLLLVSGLLCVLAAWAWWPMSQAVRPTALAQLANVADAKYAGDWARLAMGGGALTVLGALLGLWWLTLAGVGLLALAGLLRPVLWLSAFVVALPFYFGVTLPLLPQRNFSIIDLGVLGGVGLLVVHGLLFPRPQARRRPRRWRLPPSSWPAGRW
ncbi:MAG: hypothetical protein R2854_01995 [Caldilineaceae bacterium]